MIVAAAAAVVVALSPNPSHFGDLVTATVRGPGTPDLRPFVVRSHDGDTYVLQCLDPACVPGPAPRTLHVGGATVTIVSRVTAAQVARPVRSFRRQTEPPPTSYRISPRALRTALAVAIALLAVVATVVLVPVVRRLVPEPRDDRTPLERALALVRSSLGRDAADRRRALDLLARALGRREATRDALDLAWSKPLPDDARVETLLDRIEARP